jgi:hypothetical protein
MKTLEALKKSGKESATTRGHDMVKYHKDNYWINTHVSYCRKCGMDVYVTGNPAANETNIYGPAVAQDCDNAWMGKK